MARQQKIARGICTSRQRTLRLWCDEEQPAPRHFKEDGALGRPRQRQTRRETGAQSDGLLTVRGGTDKAARLPKGWTGPHKYAWFSGLPKGSPDFFWSLVIRPSSFA